MITTKKLLQYAAKEIIDNTQYNCYIGVCRSIYRSANRMEVSPKVYNSAQNFFKTTFEQDSRESTDMMVYYMGELTQENVEIRALALLFCAEMVNE